MVGAHERAQYAHRLKHEAKERAVRQSQEISAAQDTRAVTTTTQTSTRLATEDPRAALMAVQTREIHRLTEALGECRAARAALLAKSPRP